MLKEKWLITIDLDGTFLKTNSGEWENNSFAERNVKAIKKVMKLGHEVAIVTGRPWRDSKTIYEAIGLNTIIANFNGSHIHFPNNKSFLELNFSMNKDILLEALKLKSLQKLAKNYVVEIGNETKIKNEKDVELIKKLNLTEDSNFLPWDVKDGLETNPQSAFVDLKYKDNLNEIYELLLELKRKYGNSMLFRIWDHRKEWNFVGLEITPKGATKGTAMKYIASYYNINLKNTIAFGDGLNDREMLLDSAVGVVMKNAKGTIKTYGDDITDYTNDEAGVGRYLEKFFDLK